jgi:hypothetical protein
MNGGDRREPSFKDNADRECFLARALPAQMTVTAGI